MVFVGMEGKFHLYEHGHQAKLQALENVVQTPLDGPFDHEDCYGKFHLTLCQGCIHSHNSSV